MNVLLPPPSRPLLTARRFFVVLALLALGCLGTMLFAGHWLWTHSFADAHGSATPAAAWRGKTADGLPSLEHGLVRRNLEVLGLAADSWFAAHPQSQAVSYADLRAAPDLRLELTPILNESYAGIAIARGWTQLAVELPDGGQVEIRRAVN